MTDPRDWPELYDPFAWIGATPARRLSACAAISSALGGLVVPETGLARVGVPGEWVASTRRAVHRTPKMPRLVHPPSGLRFVVVPGGVARLGLSEAEAAVFDDAALLDTASGERAWVEGELLEVQALVEAAPSFVSRLAPFLLCEVAHDALEPVPWLRLPSEAEWEHAYRGGTTAPFPWGDEIPDGPPADEHPLGLVELGRRFEAVDGPWEPGRGGAVMRGGALEGGFVWQRLLSASRTVWSRAAEPQVRPALSIPFALPQWSPDEVLEAESVVSWRMARVIEGLVERMRAHAPEVYEPARAQLWQRVGGAARWTGQGALVFEALLEAALDPEVPAREALLVLSADLVAGRHPAVIGRGLDLSNPVLARVATRAPALAMRGTLLRWSENLTRLSFDSEAAVRAAWALLMAMVPEVAVTQREHYERAALRESDPPTLASLLFGWAHVPGVDPETFAPWTGHEDPLVSGLAWLARAVAGGRESWPEGVVSSLSEMVLDPREMPWSYGRLDSVVALVSDLREPLAASLASERGGPQ